MKEKKKILIIGASGAIGKALVKYFKDFYPDTFRGRDVIKTNSNELTKILSKYDIIINLAGKSIFTLWTRGNKKEIFNSRVNTSQKIVNCLLNSDRKPEHFINASAIGIYKDETPVTELKAEYSKDFMASVIKAWEEEVNKLKKSDIALTILRIGIVLTKEGGAYKTLRLLTRFYLGAVFNGGKQSLSFICIKDLVRAVDFIIDNRITGPVNIVSPEISNYSKLMARLRKETGAIFIWNLPGFIIRIVLGGTSSLILKGYKVLPEILIKNGFLFNARTLDSCIKSIEN